MVGSYTLLLVNIDFFFIAAPPEGSYPVIAECKSTKKGQACILSTQSTINITCSVFRYYPDISLLFRHNLAEVESVESQESVNSDLTLNKSVTITAVSSDEPYTCVTSNVPGSSLNEYMTTVFVTENRDSTTVGATVPHNEEQNNNSQQELLIGKQYHLSIERCSSKCGFLSLFT